MRNVGCADGSIHDEPCGTITTSVWAGARSGAVARINTLPGLPARNVAVALDCAPRGTVTRLGEKVPLPACPVPDGSCAKSMVRFRSFATGWNWLSRKSTVSRAVSPTRSVAGLIVSRRRWVGACSVTRGVSPGPPSTVSASTKLRARKDPNAIIAARLAPVEPGAHPRLPCVAWLQVGSGLVPTIGCFCGMRGRECDRDGVCRWRALGARLARVLAHDRLVREGLKPLAHVDAGPRDQLDHQDTDEPLPGVDPVGRAVGSTPRIAAERAVRTGHPEVCDDGEAEPEADPGPHGRSEEHTSELQSPCNLVCRLLLEKKKNTCRNSADGKACMEECSQ